MRIRSLLALTMGASLAMILVSLGSLWYSTDRIWKANKDLSLANDIGDTVLERIMLRDEYYIHREERPKSQWLAKTATLAGQLTRARLDFQGAKDQEILVEMSEVGANINSLFAKLIENTRGMDSDPIARSLAAEYDQTLFSQLNIRASILRDDAARLVELRFGELSFLMSASNWLFGACLAVVVAVVLVNGFLIGRILNAGIGRLKEGTTVIGGGELSYRLATDSGDEISEVALGINRMTESLAGLLTSKANLEESVALRTAELRTSNEELESFAYSVAHDLRAPLRSIDGYSRLLEEELGPALSAEGARILAIIRGGAVKMDDLIGSLLEISRLGRTDLCLSAVDMRSTASDAFALVAGPEVASDFDFRVGNLPDAYVDAPMIERVWANLLSNALKYSVPSPRHSIEVGGRAEDGVSVYYVRDRGVGFDPRYADKLFGMFNRLHGEVEFPGNGVGLAMVKKIVARHGGKVWAEGRLGEGSTFYFSIPRRS